MHVLLESHKYAPPFVHASIEQNSGSGGGLFVG